MLFLLSACSEIDKSGEFDTDTVIDTGDTDDTDNVDDTGDTGPAEELTLSSCTTDVGDGVAAFYSAYFLCAEFDVDGARTKIHTHGLPPHKSAYYPEGDPNWEAWDDRGGDYQPNPNTIATQDTNVWIPDEPDAKGITVTADMVDGVGGTNEHEFPGGGVGVGLDSVLLFSGAAGPGDDIAEEQYSFDSWDGHPQEQGVYHDHSPNPAQLAVLVYNGYATTNVPGAAEVELYGVMCDGTVVLGCTELDGSEPKSAEFDAQNGHLGDLAGADGTVYFTGRYHTHVCPGEFDDPYFPEIQYYQVCDRL